MEKEIEELKEMVADYEELLKSAKEERDEYKNALEEVESIVRKLV